MSVETANQQAIASPELDSEHKQTVAVTISPQIETLPVETLLAMLEQLSAEDLLNVQAATTAALRHKLLGNGSAQHQPSAAPAEPETVDVETETPTPPRPNTPEEREAIIARYAMPKLSEAEMEAHMTAMFSPEVLARIKTVDLSRLPSLPDGLTMTDLISENREDRF